MGDWYWIGVCVGLGVGVGVLVTGIVAGSRLVLGAAMLSAAAAGILIGLGLGEWDEAIGGAIGGPLGVAGAAQVVGGALRRGGTRFGTAAFVGLAAAVVAALAWVPAVGYLEGLAVPALAARLRRRGGERYAGLRILARD
jgi:hypothetical protein